MSQCGYNTALDILSSGLPALFVPFAAAGEDEQTQRAERLSRMGLARMLPPVELDGPRLAAEIESLLRFRPQPFELDLGGAAASTCILERLVRDRARRLRPAAACA